MRTAIIYGVVYVVYAGVYIGIYELSKRRAKKYEREEEKRNFQKKAEANGWTIVECDYTITSRSIEAI